MDQHNTKHKKSFSFPISMFEIACLERLDKTLKQNANKTMNPSVIAFTYVSI